MAILNKGQTFSDGEQVTSAKLNTAVDGATFASGAVDDVSTQLSGGAIIVKDGGVTTAKIADDAVTTTKIADNNVTTAKIADNNVITSKIADSNVTTAKIANNNVTTSKIANSNITTEKIADSNVTKGKIENVANMKVLGNTSGSSAAPQEVSILDEDDMESNSNTALATQQSIKAYVDSLTEYNLKYSGSTGTVSVTNSFSDWDLSSVVGSNRAMVIIELRDSSTFISLFARTKNSSVSPYSGNSFGGWGAPGMAISTSNTGGTIMVLTDELGVIELKGTANASSIDYTIQAYQKLA